MNKEKGGDDVTEQERKRPQTLKQRIRSWVWNFLMEDSLEVSINHREISQLVRQAGLTTIDDTGEAEM